MSLAIRWERCCACCRITRALLPLSTCATTLWQPMPARSSMSGPESADGEERESIRGDRQLDEAGGARRMVDTVRGACEILRFRVGDVGDEALRIAVVEWKPTALDLHHHPVS